LVIVGFFLFEIKKSMMIDDTTFLPQK